MYCLECGSQIPENSKFCSHCGKIQTEGESTLKEKIAEVIIEKEITRQVVEAHKSFLDYQFLKKAMGWYFAWILLHFCLLLIGSDGIFDNGNMGADDFWPFGYSADFEDVENYDITEFLVYSIVPLAILIIWSMVRTQKRKEIIKNN